MTTSFFKRFPFLRLFILIAGLVVVQLTTGCYPIKINEIVTLEKNGSGTAILTYGIYMPDASEAPQSRKLFEEVNEAARDTRGITAFDMRLSHNRVKDNAVLAVYTATIRFDTIAALPDLAEKISQCPSVKPLLEKTGTTLLSYDWELESVLRPDQVTIQRKLPLPDLEDKPPVHMNMSAPGSGAEKEKDFLFLYTFPEKTAKNNAMQTLNDGKTLIWSYDLDQLPREPQYQTFTLNSWYVLPQNTLAGLGGLLAGAILATIFTLIRRRKKKKSANMPA